MKMSALSTALAATVLASSATAIEIDNESCDITVKGDMSWNAGVLAVHIQDDKKMVITPAHTLTINGHSVALNDEEKEWVAMYYNNINTAIPMTLDITYDALELAGSALNEAFGELIGTDNGLVDDVDALFADLRRDMDAHFYDDNGQIRVNSADFQDDGWFAQSWENRLESQVEDIIEQSAGRLLIALGTQMLSSDGDMDDFADRMENWEDDFEQRIEQRATAIEERADALCEVLQKADYVESKMQKHIAGLENLDMFTIDGKSMMKM
ncbi:DUF2884 family protein [Aestuariibacter sp. A3R04]|uniref:DUF2884 family protein n=1 Tax=Aestuariibacter sp. A3R04 TaxID=2841571 RepID=UPI001C08DEF2|nr:DUF2884 family protein [Aestuariibacter sp. A3R04]MBU3021982.1 YggN family protein [Aestuariibacter sp. A3R04]